MSIPAPERCWEAVQNNDASFDGQFVVAVRTTKIYCRPSCTARLPLRKNVEFFPVPAMAESNGYRACKRCLPKDVSSVDEQTERVQMICQYIDDHLDEPCTLEEMGTAIGWSPYHLQRTFKQVVGITPRQYADMQRIARFKEGLRNGESVTNAALEAGYSSSSRIYAQADQHMGMTPKNYRKGGDDIAIAYSIWDTDSLLGKLLVAMTERGVCSIKMGEVDSDLIESLHEEFPAAHIFRDDEYLYDAVQNVLNYLQGWKPNLSLPLDIRVTAFQKRVLQELLNIPYGETRTYGEIAQAIGQPKAARAVGRACGANPVPLVVPCHRVVGSDGSLTGYAYGTDRKRYLLDMEQHEDEEEQEIAEEKETA